MKKIFVMLIVAMMLMLLAACGNATDNNDSNGTDGSTPPDYTDGTDSTDDPDDNNGTDSTDDNDDNENPSPDNQPETYLLKTFSETDEYGNAGTYTEINAQYSTGEKVELEATVNSGYNFVGWFINDICISEDVKYVFVMKTSNAEIEARYNYYTVSTYSYSDDYGKAGVYTELKNKKVSTGEQISVEATVNDGYNFEGWYINNVCVSEKLTYSFLMKEKDVSLEARWSYYTVSVTSYSDERGTAGSYSKKNNEKVSVGETVVLNATVNKGFNFEGWYINGNHISSELEYSFIMKEENLDIQAVYSYYSITVESYSDEEGMAGTYPKKSNEKVSEGETVTLTATVKEGYNFEGWYIDGVCVCSDLTYQFVMEKSDKSIWVEYSSYLFTTSGYLYRYPYTMVEEVVGTYTKYNEKKISEGEVVTLVATVGEGYTFEGWYINDVCVSTDLECTYTMTKRNVYIEARYTYYTLSTDAYYDEGTWTSAFEDNMGSYTQYNDEKIRVGDTVTLTATAKAGYRFIGWEHGYTIVCEEPTYTFVMSKEDESYVAVFGRI